MRQKELKEKKKKKHINQAKEILIFDGDMIQKWLFDHDNAVE